MHSPFQGTTTAQEKARASAGDVFKTIKENEVKFVDFRFNDTRGKEQHVTVPVSHFDDELRFRIARAIYSHSSFWNYAAMANPPIRVVVNRGRVTLEGVVHSNVERMLARSLASGFNAFEIKNALKTDAEVREEMERKSD